MESLGRADANFAPLSPLGFLTRSASIYPDRVAVIHGDRRIVYRDFEARARRLASALTRLGIGPGDTVSAVLPNVPAMLEAHFGVPMTGAVLNTVNTRLDARTIGYILEHGEAKVLLTDREYAGTVGPALAKLQRKPLVVEVEDALYQGPGDRLGEIEYEAFLGTGSEEFVWTPPADESAPIALNYTSGTTGNPKGVVYHHRGAFLESVGNIMMWPLPPRAVYLWTLPMFHCNGWCYTWAVTAMAGTHLPARVDPPLVFQLIARRPPAALAAPTVLDVDQTPPPSGPPGVVELETDGSRRPPRSSAMSEMGFNVTPLRPHRGSRPSPCASRSVGGRAGELAEKLARQGVRYPTLDGQMVADPKTLRPVPADGRTIGEVVLRGNTVMLGYLKDRAATDAAFEGGWFHTGDLAVQHPDGYIEIKDRAKDIIISGGENISSIEVEIALNRHPAVLMSAVVARPDEKWGETPCAFVQLRPDAQATAEELIGFCRDNLPHFAIPRTVVFGALPTTSTGKVQKYTLRERARTL
jgi:fatty-acyl-CoA synthase